MSSSRDHAHSTTDGQGNPTLAVTKAFADEKGNRFVFPSMVIWPDEEAQATNPSKSDLIFQAISLSAGVRITADEGWLEFDPARFPNVRTEILHPGFAHGGATVLLFSGPEFEASLSDGTGRAPSPTGQLRDEEK